MKNTKLGPDPGIFIHNQAELFQIPNPDLTKTSGFGSATLAVEWGGIGIEIPHWIDLKPYWNVWRGSSYTFIRPHTKDNVVY